MARLDRAPEEVRRVLALAPGSVLLVANSHLFLGQILMGETGRLAEAKAEFEMALRLAPENTAAREGLARIARRGR